MLDDMKSEVVTAQELLATDLTDVRLGTIMNIHVANQVVLVVERFLALTAFMFTRLRI